MKQRYIGCVLFLSLLLLPLGTFLLTARSSAEAVNLIPNANLETGTTTPTSWASNKWGTNGATFQYKKDSGYNSTRSVRVNMSQYSTGDAKWYFEPVAVQPNTNYTFSDHYMSSVPTHVVVASFDSAGNPTYIDAATNVVASSAAWKQVSVNFKTPANSAKVSVYHLISRNGWLQIDNTSLTAATTTPPLPTVLPPNGSLEQAASGAPVDWEKQSWGSNTPTFAYPNNGRTGTKSVKVTVANYVDGDAKWAFKPVALTPGKDYRFKTWYKTNTQPHVVARYIAADGTETYHGMPNPEPAANSSTTWAMYSDTFTVPQGTVGVSVFMFLTGNGWVQTDDYSIESYTPVSFSQPLVSVTFDDGFEENNTTVLPVMNNLGLKSTQCYATEYVEGIPAAVDAVKAFHNSGHEICSHTVSHPDLTTLNATDLTYQLTHSKQFLESITGPVKNFASPFGAYNAKVNTEIKKYYRSHRTVDEGYNTKDNFNIYKIRVQNMKDTTTLAEFQSWLDKAKADNVWLVLVYHKVTAGTPGPFDTKNTDFNAQMNALKASGLTVKTYNAALDEVSAQL
jgi:peptidoglycan/xylan/chitin deacetylase (PgdA/CDA1 family)